jgi:hypothetical protein
MMGVREFIEEVIWECVSACGGWVPEATKTETASTASSQNRNFPSWLISSSRTVILGAFPSLTRPQRGLIGQAHLGREILP